MQRLLLADGVIIDKSLWVDNWHVASIILLCTT